MKIKTKILLSLAALLAVTLIAAASSRRNSGRESHGTGKHARLIGAILVPGNPLRFDISWVDQTRGRYYLGEAGNAAVDVFDAENDLYLGRIGGFHGNGAADDPCRGPQGMGPSGVVVTADNHLWATDAHGLVKVFDLNSVQPPFDIKPVATVNTGSSCRADEIGFDPKDHVILVGNPAEKPPYGTLISSNPPYMVLSKIPFPDARGFEQPLCDPDFKGGRMLVTVPGLGGTGAVVVLNLKNPQSPVIEATYPTQNCASGLALGPSQHLLVGCGGGKPLLIMDALNGSAITTVDQTHGVDEVWYNPGDNRFYAPAANGSNPTLSIIDAGTGMLIDNLPAGPGVHSVAAYRENNHIFVPIAPPNANSPTDACNVMFGLPAKRGCIAVYAPVNN